MKRIYERLQRTYCLEIGENKQISFFMRCIAIILALLCFAAIFTWNKNEYGIINYYATRCAFIVFLFFILCINMVNDKRFDNQKYDLIENYICKILIDEGMAPTSINKLLYVRMLQESYDEYRNDKVIFKLYKLMGNLWRLSVALLCALVNVLIGMNEFTYYTLVIMIMLEILTRIAENTELCLITEEECYRFLVGKYKRRLLDKLSS